MKINTLKLTTYLLASCLVFTFTACEGDGKDGEASFVNILTEGNPPVAEAGANQSVLAGDTVTLDGSASTDSDGTITKYLWTIPSSGTKEGITVTQTLPASIAPGDYTVALTVTDNDGNTDNDTMTITVIDPTPTDEPVNNTAPVAKDVRASPGAIGGCSTLSPRGFNLDASDADGDALTYIIVTQPASGTVTTEGGDLTLYMNTSSCLIPETNLPLVEDTFTYKVNDGKVDSNIATVTLDFRIFVL
ncbi:MAG: PKD domain-containing protein [Sulfurovum sp.]|nr:PKD domain-containing protein [Sulfurovum sp.]